MTEERCFVCLCVCMWEGSVWVEENGEHSVTPLTNTHTRTVHTIHNTGNIQCYIDSVLAHTGTLTHSHTTYNTRSPTMRFTGI